MYTNQMMLEDILFSEFVTTIYTQNTLKISTLILWMFWKPIMSCISVTTQGTLFKQCLIDLLGVYQLLQRRHPNIIHIYLSILKIFLIQNINRQASQVTHRTFQSYESLGFPSEQFDHSQDTPHSPHPWSFLLSPQFPFPPR